MYVIIDTNGYYSSQELRQPLIILSHDKQIIATCGKARALGFGLGQTINWNETMIGKNGLQIIVSNYKSIEKIYDSILQILSTYSSDLEYSSANEIFIKFTHNKFYTYGYMEQLRNYITSITGIPISIGIGESKEIARAEKTKPLFQLEKERILNYAS